MINALYYIVYRTDYSFRWHIMQKTTIIAVRLYQSVKKLIVAWRHEILIAKGEMSNVVLKDVKNSWKFV